MTLIILYFKILTLIILDFKIMKIIILDFKFFFFQAEDGIRDGTVTGVQTCALPILPTGGRCDAGMVAMSASVARRSTPKASSPACARSGLVSSGMPASNIAE